MYALLYHFMLESYCPTPFARWKVNAFCFLFLISTIQAHPRFRNLSAADEDHPMCTDSPDWTAGVFSSNDCLDALYKLEDTDYKIYRSRNFEFLAPGANRRTSLDAVRLPLRYTAGSCTLLITMLSGLPEHSLPGQMRDRGEYGKTDRSKFSYLWSVAAWVDGNCIAMNSMMGWCATGGNFDIGVFFASTKSKFNKEVDSGRLKSNSSGNASVSLELAKLLDIDLQDEGNAVES